LKRPRVGCCRKQSWSGELVPSRSQRGKRTSQTCKREVLKGWGDLYPRRIERRTSLSTASIKSPPAVQQAHLG
jgi:hypothetical protein